MQASLDYKQRLQQLFFPEGIAFDGNRFNRTSVAAPLFRVLGAWRTRRGKSGDPNFHELEPDRATPTANRPAARGGVSTELDLIGHHSGVAQASAHAIDDGQELGDNNRNGPHGFDLSSREAGVDREPRADHVFLALWRPSPSTSAFAARHVNKKGSSAESVGRFRLR